MTPLADATLVRLSGLVLLLPGKVRTPSAGRAFPALLGPRRPRVAARDRHAPQPRPKPSPEPARASRRSSPRSSAASPVAAALDAHVALGHQGDDNHGR